MLYVPVAEIVGSYEGHTIFIKRGATATDYVGSFASGRMGFTVQAISDNGAVGGVYSIAFPDDNQNWGPYRVEQTTADKLEFSRQYYDYDDGSWSTQYSTWTKDSEPSPSPSPSPTPSPTPNGKFACMRWAAYRQCRLTNK